MRDESLTEGVKLFPSERRAVVEQLTIESELSLELRRTIVLLAIFVGLLILRFS